jgi:hypothetical protein
VAPTAVAFWSGTQGEPLEPVFISVFFVDVDVGDADRLVFAKNSCFAFIKLSHKYPSIKPNATTLHTLAYTGWCSP